VCTIRKNRSTTGPFRNLGTPNRVWTIGAVHGDLERLSAIHDAVLQQIKPGDRLLYLGNYTGYGEQSAACVDELLTFRRLAMSLPGMMCGDIMYLRGTQEEMWQKLLQLQFAPNPTDVLLWMLGNGLSNTLYSYGLSPHDGIEACRSGTMAITKWTNKIRETVRAHPGHEKFGTELLRAVHTSKDSQYPMLFVHAGLNALKPLEEQGDSLWWANEAFDHIYTAYKPFEKVVRGYDPGHRGVNMNCITATIDGGCGFGGTLVCAGFEQDGSVAQMLEA
jgi:serine/threonine protein phosphatase 1